MVWALPADASDRRRATRIWGLAPGWDLFADVRDLLLELFPGESVEEILVVGGQLARQKIQVFCHAAGDSGWAKAGAKASRSAQNTR